MSSYIDQALQQLVDSKVMDEAGWAQGYINANESRLREEMSYVLANIPNSHRILEYGSAPFWFTLAMKNAGYDVLGTDIAPERFKNVENLHLNLIKVDYDQQPLPVEDQSIDAIICNEVFEHMRHNLIFTFKEAHRVLRVGGELHITTPNLLSAKGLFNLIFREKAYSCAGDLHFEWSKIERIGHMGHVREYTAREATDFLKKIGFKVRKVEYYSSMSRPKGKLERIFRLMGYMVPRFRANMRVVVVK